MSRSDWIALTLAAGVLALLGLSIYDRFSTRPVGSESTVATPSPVLKRVPTEQVTVKAPVKVYKGDTKARLKLPASVRTNSDEQVIAASQVRADLRPQTVTTTINTETGAVTSYVKADPYPWFAIETRGEAKLAYGYKYDSLTGQTSTVGRFAVGYDVVRIKAFTAGVLATVDTDGDAFAGIGITYRW